MVFTPVIPGTGLVGWNFLQSTYDRQFAAFSNTAQIKSDSEYVSEKFSSTLTVDEFVDDPRLLRSTLTAFGLEGEEWKKGFIKKVLNEVNDPESTFLTRLNNPAYTRLAETLSPVGGLIIPSSTTASDISLKFREKSFEIAVGNVDNNIRLSLNYETEINELVKSESTNETNIFRILGSVPVRTVLETALNLPQDVRKLDLEQQAKIFEDRLKSTFRISDVTELTEPENVERVIQRFSAISQLSQGPAAGTPGSTALALLTGVGAVGSQNLFLSGF